MSLRIVFDEKAIDQAAGFLADEVVIGHIARRQPER